MGFQWVLLWLYVSPLAAEPTSQWDSVSWQLKPLQECGVADSMKVSPSKPKQWEVLHILLELLWVQFIKNSWYLIISALPPWFIWCHSDTPNVLSKISTSHWNDSLAHSTVCFSSQEEVAAAGFSTAADAVAFLAVFCALQQTVIDWWC